MSTAKLWACHMIYMGGDFERGSERDLVQAKEWGLACAYARCWALWSLLMKHGRDGVDPRLVAQFERAWAVTGKDYPVGKDSLLHALVERAVRRMKLKGETMRNRTQARTPAKRHGEQAMRDQLERVAGEKIDKYSRGDTCDLATMFSSRVFRLEHEGHFGSPSKRIREI